ncbi:PREDICTED: ATP-binding cassette sub-family A member 13 [Rhagoletis zephyria]|uniref:ATP-binding cassette sub-family A member 13 n=1 Tax=Rhagoletis zephyria TaxID=28612 RepID=UPI000811497C|nr:PREDICTED: ATP-binding cassette sub-family A member 13 [Rhagoletis zephyria]
MQLQRSFSISQLKALLRKDGLVRLRQPVMTVVQVAWPCLIFMLLYLIRLKFGPEQIEDCQFATRLLPTKNQVLPSFYSYICSLENKCMSTNPYEETTSWKNAPMKPIIDIVNIFVTDDRMFDAVIDLPEKANFINAVTAVVTGGHFNEIRQSIGDVIGVVPQVEDFLNGTFDIRRLFSDRRTFVKAGYLMCGHPFPSTDTIPLVNDILYDTEDFSKVNDDEINVMPTKYCKQLYLNITTTTTGKLTWNVVKPLIHGKILYAPVTEETQSIMMHANTTFEELNRLKRLSVAVADIVTKLREDEQFQKSFDSLLKLATSPTVRAYIGDDINVDEIVGIVNRIQTDPLVYDVIMTIKNILECFSVDRFIPVATAKDLQLTAYDLNEKRLFFAAAYFNRTDNEVSYKLHMDTENTQPTFENKNRFWFPGPAGSMIRDMKYHRGFVQIKNAIDMGIIKHMKLLHKNVTEETSFELGTHSPLTIEIETGSGFGEDEDDDDWSTPQKDDTDDFVQSQNKTSNANSMETMINSDDLKVHTRKRRQALLDLIGMFGGGNTDALSKYGVEGLQMHTKQFPYPAYTHDNMKTGIYLAQAIQVAFFLGLVAEIASCVRHFIWMRESRNTMIMRSMGMKPYSELTSWILVTFVELVVIFVGVTAILYVGGLLMYASFIFVMFFLIVFGGCLISFCYMCSTFFTSATIGAVATALLFFISYCPYIIVLLFDSHLNSFENFCINLSFTTAFSHAWSHIMRMELQEIGLGFVQVFQEGFSGEFGFAFFMIVLDAIIYGLIGYLVRRFLDDEYCFTEVQREDLDSGVGATMTNVSKLYDEQIAVSDVNLSLPKDKITCLLGRNGAGKSTIIKMLTGQVVQSTGRVILSQAMSSRDEFDKVGVCSQDNILIPNLTAREHLELYASIKLKHNYKTEVDKTLKSLKFGKYEDYQAAQLSGGYQRRLCVALAFIGSPNVVILDEPCNGVDSKARKDIWELIQRLRKGRAVVFATHFLDEAEFLSDVIVIMKNGKIIAKHSPATLQEFCTSGYDVLIHCNDTQTITEIRNTAEEVLASFKEPDWLETGDIRFQIPYDQNGSHKSIDFLNYLQNLQLSDRISDLRVESRNLAQIFSDLHEDHENGFTAAKSKLDMRPVELKNSSGANIVSSGSLCFLTAVRNLLWKRLLHFSRNYRILMCVIVLPAIFELFAMWFVTYRLEDDYDKTISFTRELYPKTMQMFSMELNKTLTNAAYDSLAEQCSDESPCREFGNSSAAFHWILKSMNQYQEKRYGGYSFNDTNAIVWYNNKGYHAMMAWLNDLNTKLLQVELGDNNFSITAFNEPWKLGAVELSTTSVLRQAGDSSMVFILLIAFSLVVAVSSVFLVNERVKGEKLQQKLCGVNLATYWGVAFVWDFLVMLLAILVCGAIIFAFGLPVFVARQNVAGIFVLALLFAFACIPGVHVFEKCFNDSSVAIVTIFCLNIIIPLFTMANIVLLGVVGDSPVWDDWRYFLNRAFLIFPQHAFGDGLLEICKNYMVSLVFQRYDIESYKHPIFSDLLLPHMLALFLLGIFFIIINVLLENGQIYKLSESILIRLPFYQKYEDKQAEELKIVSIQNSLKIADKDETPQVLKVDNLYKCYGRGPYVIRNVTFAVKAGECFGLLGKNGTGKSTIFKMLSGELQPNVGAVNYFNGEIAYCPQTNPLDSLLTVEECIRFYGKLRRVANVDKLIEHVLESFQLKSYRHVLVKNLSGGNRRKLTVALTCCGRTTVVLMDEPTSDMDPVTRAIVYRTIHELLAMQRAVVLTSHSVSEIDAICHRIAVLKDGQILTSGSPESMSTQYGGYYDVVIYGDNQLIESVEKAIHLRLPQCVDFHTYTHSIKFSLKIKTCKPQESDSDTSQTTPNDKAITLAGLFTELEALSEQYEGHLHYTVNHCRLDAVFERILDSSEQPSPLSAGLNKSGLMGSPSTGYIHNGYVETETIT